MDLSFIQLSSNSLIETLIIPIICILIFSYLTKSSKKATPPPLAKSSWPILGHLPKLATPSTILHKTLASMADHYGPIFGLRLGHRRVYVVSTHELAKECFTKNDVALSSRPNLLASEHLGFNYAMLGFTPYGPYWRELRKLVTLHLLSSHQLGRLKLVQVAEVGGLVRRLGAGPQASVDLKEEFLELSLGIIGRVVVGKKYAKEEGMRWQKGLEEVFYLFGVVTVGDFVPWLRWLDLGGYERAMKRVHKELDGLIQGMIDEHRERNYDEDRDFMDVMIRLFDDGASLMGGYDPDHVIKATVFNLIAGGSDTTATTLIWTMSLLLNNPISLHKAQAELDLQIGQTRLVTELDIPSLPYLQAVVKEALRLYPPSPLSTHHLVIEDCTIGGYHIEKGCHVMINMSKIHRDPKVWPEPYEFKPERFLTTHKNVDVKGQHFELIPFGAGRRGCPGAGFALQVVHLSLASLLHAFEFSTPNGARVDMTESSGLSNMKVGPLEVILKHRLPRHLFD